MGEFDDTLKLWLEQKRIECNSMNNSTEPPPGLYCPGIFDSWLCWPHTAAGTSAFATCPSFVTGFDRNRLAHKDCEANGTWFRHPVSNKEWSNYTTCVNVDDLSMRQSVVTVYEAGYSISLIALLLSLCLLTYFRSLRCARITLHMNLFGSFAANNTLWLLWYEAVIKSPNVITENPAWCKVLHVIIQYVLLTNYSWMLCEGLYLHTVLVSAFVAEQRLLKGLVALGWALPAVAVTAYTIVRGTSFESEDSKECWMNESSHTTILVVVVAITIFLNLVFLCNIVRVLCTKLRANPARGSQGPSRTALQAFRATFLLVPLLGLQYLVTPFRPPPGNSWEHVYEYVSATTASLQGLCVATLYCFCNGEVIAQVKRKWRTSMFRPRANSCTATTVSFVRSTPNALGGEEKVSLQARGASCRVANGDDLHDELL
ncbi:diuretic hormone 31 Receptor isoform X2 [Arctopsyche grandis]|uniref:diuretic hormone 31 Receptor isoform X2 n=1 Tax=Arctopsyche grandis TaxID=121162 RepID=UPI00406D93DF